MKAKNFVALLLIAFLTSCVNQIDSEIEPIGNKVPITFAAKIAPVNTRVVENAFEIGDKVGLYATIAGSSLDGERYIDNLLLSYGKSKRMIPDRDVYYPTSGENLDFYAYYPYRSEFLACGETTFSVSVAENQSDDAVFTQSDFMVAEKMNVEHATAKVELEFNHKLSKYIICLSFEDENVAEAALKSNPSVLLTDFYTSALYDFSAHTFSQQGRIANMIPHGEWIREGNVLRGKELLIVPQDVSEQRLVLDIAGKAYNCVPEVINLSSGYQYAFNISAGDLNEGVLNEIKATISPWKDGEEQNAEVDDVISKIYTEALTFNTSNIYRVYNGGTPIAEICKEYLYKEGLVDSRAIVVYPMVNGVTNLEEGLVLQLLDETGDVHGGKVSWNKATNGLTYTAGESAPIKSFYINSNKEIVTSKPNDALAVNVNAYVLRDMRSGSLQKYPLVKIATQYWMREDLYATHYVDGSLITEVTALNGTAGYAKNADASHYFYTGEAVETGMLTPDGWRIPNNDEWEELNSYLKNTDALKDGEWEELSGQPYYPGNNKTGFNMHAVGAYVDRNGLLTLVNTGTLNAYWIDPEQSLQMQEAVQVYQFLSSDNEFIKKSGLVKDKDYYQAFSVRCIKE